MLIFSIEGAVEPPSGCGSENGATSVRDILIVYHAGGQLAQL